MVLHPVRHPAAILAPRHLDGVGRQILAADVVVLTQLSATQAGEVAFGSVGAGAVPGERHRVVDAHHVIIGVQPIPAARLVGVDDAAHGDALTDQGNSVGFFGDHKRQRLAVALAGDDDRLTLSGNN